MVVQYTKQANSDNRDRKFSVLHFTVFTSKQYELQIDADRYKFYFHLID